MRMLRGGSYFDDSRYLRSPLWTFFEPIPVRRGWYFGFRVVVIRRKP